MFYAQLLKEDKAIEEHLIRCRHSLQLVVLLLFKFLEGLTLDWFGSLLRLNNTKTFAELQPISRWFNPF